MSAEQTVESGQQPTLTIHAIHGNLTVQGWSEGRIWARAAADSLDLQSDAEGGWSLAAPGDAQVYVPQGARVVVQEVHGDSQIGNVGGDLIFQECHGNLALSQTGPATLDSIGGDASIHNIAGAVSIESVAGNLTLARIQGALQVQSCAGDLAVRTIQGPVEFEAVAGNATLSEIQGPASLVTVAGNLMAKNVAGPLTARNVHGNASLLQVAGPVQIDQCAGNLAVRGASPSVDSRVAGNASLRLELPVGGRCQVRAGGDISCRVPPQVSAQVRLVSRGNDIRVKRLGADLQRRQGSAEFTLGSGEGRIDLEAGGAILLVGKLEDTPEFQFGPFNVEMDAEAQREMMARTGEWIQQYTEQVEAQMESFSAQLDERLSQLGTSDEIAARVQAKVQQAMRKAEDKIAEAMRQAEQRARAAEREAVRMERRQRMGYGYTPPVPPTPPTPLVPPRAQRAKSTPVSDEERMTILRMVEAGKISVEQAEKLLAALDSAG